MADEALMKVGLYVDAFNKIRLLRPDFADATVELVEQIKNIITQLTAFCKSTEAVIKALDELAMAVEAEKMRAISSRNALKTADKQHIADTQQLQILIREREIELERLRIELEAVQQQENTQKEYMHRFLPP